MNKTIFPQRGKCLAAIVIILVSSGVHTFAVGTSPLRAAPITLAWDPANDPAIHGYGIYYGVTNQPATNHVNAGQNLSVTLFDLQANTGYQFYAVSYDAAGNESVPSNQLLLTAPVMSRLRIAQLATGEFRLALRAAPGSVCQLEYTDALNSSTWQTLGLRTADANGDVAVIDATLPSRPSRFYRVARLALPPPFTQLQLAQLANGRVRIDLKGSPDTTWEIQYAAVASSPQWTTFATITANFTGDAAVTNSPPGNSSSRFYRAALP